MSGEGLKNVSVTATDDLGNTDTDTRSFRLDVTAPSLSIVSPADGAYLRTGFTPELTASDAQDSSPGFSCGLDAPPTNPCGAFALPSDGEHTLNVEASDDAGNETVESSTFTVDTVAPSVGFTSGPAANSIVAASDVTFGFSATDSSPLTRSCRLDGGAFGDCTSATTHRVSGLSEGPHTVTVRLTDAAGNESETSRTFTVNAVRPTVDIVSGPAEGDVLRVNSTRFGFAATGGAVSCSLDSETAFGPCSGGDSHSVSGLADGAHTFRVRVVDASATSSSSRGRSGWTPRCRPARCS